MDCCSSGHEQMFDAKGAQRDLKRYRRKGLDRTARRMVAFLVGRGMKDASVLEIGGGLGAIQVELLEAGAGRTVNLELSSGYEEAARELVRERGLEDRVERRLTDIAERPDEVEAADAVVLHRVVCCYPDAERLVAAAAEHARRLLVLSYPPRNAASRLFIWAGNLFLRLRRSDFRAYVHPPETIHGTAAGHGLRPAFEHRGLIWHVAAFERI